MTRSYRQTCGLARALDVLGDRWTLLIIRELALGPRRYGDLSAALQGLGTNLLAARLKDLETAGVLVHTTLPAPASVAVYELTPAGTELRAAMGALAAWGMMHVEPSADARARASWIAQSLGLWITRGGAERFPHTVELRIGDELLHLCPTGSSLDARIGPPSTAADLTITSDLETFERLVDGVTSIDDAVAAASVQLEGDETLAAQLFALGRMPAAPVG